MEPAWLSLALGCLRADGSQKAVSMGFLSLPLPGQDPGILEH